MDWSAGTTLFGGGALLGLAAALSGALIDYGLNLRRASTQKHNGLPGCIFYVVGGLVFTGIAALGASLLLTGGLRAALIVGAGVFAGFYAGFAILLLLWYFITPPPAAPLPTSNSDSDDILVTSKQANPTSKV